MFLHGGPGAGCQKLSAHFFNPERYRVILFDQRGCGKSTPSAGDDDATAALTDNTTSHLIDDVLHLRRELNIHGKMHVFGGSWGSTLALAYAIAHPETVQTLILRGVFLCRRVDVDYFFQAMPPISRWTRSGCGCPAHIWISRQRGSTLSRKCHPKTEAM